MTDVRMFEDKGLVFSAAMYKLGNSKMFLDEFGKEIIKNISEHLQSRKEIIEEMIKYPEQQDLVYKYIKEKGRNRAMNYNECPFDIHNCYLVKGLLCACLCPKIIGML